MEKEPASDRNPSRNAMLDDLASLIDVCVRYAILTGMDEHFVSDLRHLRTVALNNKEYAK